VISPLLQSKKKQIDILISEIDAFSGDPLIKAYLTYYLCVRISGFVEDCVRTIFSSYADANSSAHARSYIAAKLSKFPNPSMEAIFALAKEFNMTWSDDLKKKIPVPRRLSLNSVVNNRHTIAHGGTSSITLNDIKRYYQDIIVIVQTIETCCT